MCKGGWQFATVLKQIDWGIVFPYAFAKNRCDILERKHNKALVSNAKELRKNMTKEERHLWYDFLKKLPITINRQKVVGNYILDFYYSAGKIAIELDGSQHYSGEGKASDTERDAFLKSKGITVLRYSNKSIQENFEGICNYIDNFIKQSPSQRLNP